MSGIPLSFAEVRILVVGDIMLDRYIWGKVRRISPEAPVPVVQMHRTTETLGGAGNVAANLAGLGCAVTVIGICGTDQTANSLSQLLIQKKVTSRLIEDPSRPTTTKTRIMAHKQQVLRLDEENAHLLSTDVSQQVKTHIAEEMRHCQAVILSDYGKGFFKSETLCQAIIRIAHNQDLPVLVDPKGTQWQRYRGAACITPNTAELESVVGHALEEDEGLLISSARDIRSRLSVDWLLVTRGAKGMCLIDANGDATLIPAQAREVYDVSGAGDTVIASLAVALASGKSFTQAAEIANLAAGIVVGKLGTQAVLISELLTALHLNIENRYFPYSAAKMSALDAALAKVREWKDSGDTIVFTNGCFDLLHPGHISLLYQAKSLGQRLIVGLNTDASVQRLKGSGRPILSENDRAAMLSALECVDMVVHFDEDTPLNLIGAIQPDILVKGSDYTPEEVIGKDLVESYGGCVRLVDLVEGYSTTQLTRKVISGSNNNK